MSTMACQITSLTIVYSTVYSSADQRKHQSSASLAFVRGTHRWPVNSPHKWPVTRKISPLDDVIMWTHFACTVLTSTLFCTMLYKSLTLWHIAISSMFVICSYWTHITSTSIPHDNKSHVCCKHSLRYAYKIVPAYGTQIFWLAVA